MTNINENTYWEALEIWCDKWMDNLLEFIERFKLDMDEPKNSNFDLITSSPNVTIKSIEKYPYEKSVWGFASNENITWKTIKTNKQIEWEYDSMIDNPNITEKNVIETIDQEWSFIEVARRFPSLHEICERKLGFNLLRKYEPYKYYVYNELETLPEFPTAHEIQDFLNSKYLNWEKINNVFDKVKQVKICGGMGEITYDILICTMILNHMEIERDKTMRTYFQSQFKQSFMKRDIENYFFYKK